MGEYQGRLGINEDEVCIMNLAVGFFRALAIQLAKIIGFIVVGGCLLGLILWGAFK